MCLQGHALTRFSFYVILGLAAEAGAQTYYWNPSAPLLNGSGEAQRAYNWTSNANGSGAYPKSDKDDSFAADILNGAWTILDQDGYADPNGNPYVNLTANAEQVTIRARGTDVVGPLNQFVAISRSDITGDFDVSVKVASQTNSDPWAKVGILMRNNFSPSADSGGYALVAATPGNGFIFQADTTVPIGQLEGSLNTGISPAATFPCWLRLVKTGSLVRAYYKTTLGGPWAQIGGAAGTRTLQNAAVNSKIALFVSAHSATNLSTAVLDDFTGGGDLAAPGADLNFGGGTDAQAAANAQLVRPMAVKSVTFAGAKVGFDFFSSALTVSDSANFAAAKSIDAGTGALAFTGNGSQKLVPLANGPLPAISKSGTGPLVISGASVTAGKLALSAGSLNCGGRNQEFAGLAASGGSINGLDPEDTLTFSDDADFSGLSALPALGSVLLRAASAPLDFTPGTAAFNHLLLWPQPLAGNARIAVMAGTLNVRGNLVFVDGKANAGSSGEIDFRVGNPSVTLGGSVRSATAGAQAGVDALSLFLGKGVWAIKGDVMLALPAGLSADSATLDFKAESPVVQTLATGSADLGDLRHSGTGTLGLSLAGATLHAASFSQTAGVLSLNGSNLAVTGNLSVSNGSPGSLADLGSRELKAGGNLSLSGSSAARLGLNPGKAWKATAGGNLIAYWADIGGSDARASASAGSAGANCVNYGSNQNWNFQTSLPAFVLQPASKEVLLGKSVVFKAKASGGGDLAYVWRKRGDTTRLSETDSLNFGKVAASQDGAHYYCTATNSLGSVVSIDAVLTVDLPPVIDAQPVDSAVVVGSRVSFTVAAHGSAPLSYAWHRTGDAATLWAGGPTLSLDSTTAAQDGYAFFCTVANKYDSVVSRAAVLTLRFPPKITRQPANVTITAGQKATLSIAAAGTATLAYAWTRLDDTTVLSRTETLVLGPLGLGDTNTYVCRVSNPYGSVASLPAKLRVIQAATIVREPSDVSAVPDRKAVFTVGVEGAKPLVYTWRRKGDTAVLAHDTILTLDSVQLQDDGKIFVFTVQNEFGADTSREARLSVAACDTVLTVAPETLVVDESQPVMLRGKANCASVLQWNAVSGPVPRIIDPETDFLNFTAPRVAAESVIVIRFSALYASGWVSKNAVVKVREAIPDPRFSLPPAGKWSSAKPYVVRPALLNASALQAAAYHPALRSQWFISVPLADTAQAGDSLTLLRPIQKGNLDVTLCMDNGGASACAIHSVAIDPAAVGLALRFARFGAVTLDRRVLAWNADAQVRIWDFRGRILWQRRGRAGESHALPEAAARDLFRGRAHLEIGR